MKRIEQFLVNGLALPDRRKLILDFLEMNRLEIPYDRFLQGFDPLTERMDRADQSGNTGDRHQLGGGGRVVQPARLTPA
jgi:hypothetical protein